MDLFYYDAEEFWFHDGRLLLRGNNGTGKSKVLALTLPFLLDGDLSAHRVEPDADPKKRMEWNLLLGGAHPHPERLGYTWLEFGRLDEDGTPRYRTLGCGLKAVSGRGIARHWYFVTGQRVGDGLRLVDATGIALTRDRLDDALGTAGTVYDRARDYRRAVDEALFELGEQRYGALVDLLVQLRAPQLSKRPSEAALSAALTEALPPLDQAVVADVAEAFRSLQEDRDALTAMTEARQAADTFLGQYRRYARILTRRRAARPRDAQSAYEGITGKLRTAREEFEAADQALDLARKRDEELRAERIRLEARDRALRTGPEMRSARELESAAERARRLTEEAERATGRRDDQRRRVDDLRRRDSDARHRLARAKDQLGTARRFTADAAVAAGIMAEHRERIDGPLDHGPEVDPLRRLAHGLVERQRRAVAHLNDLISAVERTGRELAGARRKLSELDAEAAELAERRTGAERDAADRGRELVTAVRRHLAVATELTINDPARSVAGLELWVDTLDGPNPIVAAVVAAGQEAADALAGQDAELAGAERAVRRRLAELADDIARLEAGEHDAPPPPHTREPAGRADRPGAPLWQLVDFREQVPEADRAGIEAALEAAGILDAWVTPTGEALAADTGDVVLCAGEPVSGNLSVVLRPAVDRDDPRAAAVSDATVAAVVGTVGFGEGRTWVDAAGRFRVDVLAGAWRKPVAQYIGRGAREAARRARLLELRAERDAAADQLAGVERDRRHLTRRRATLAREVTELPADTALRHCHAELAALAGQRRRLVERRGQADDVLRTVTAARDAARAELTDGARDSGLPADRAALMELGEGLQRYREAVAGLWPLVVAARDAVRQAEETADDLEQAESRLAEETEHAAGAARDGGAAREAYRALRDTVGATVAELQRRLEDVEKLLHANERATERARREAEQAIQERGKAEGRRDNLTGQLEDAAVERTAAAESFRRFAGTGLLAVALPALEAPDPDRPWAPDPTVRLARRVDGELSDVPADDHAWDRAQQRVNQELKSLQDTLSRHGDRASADLGEDGIVVRIEFQGRPATVPDLTAALATEVGDRERLLNEREREILENHLVNEVASTLQELISAAEERVAAMNAELERRPLSTGMRLRLLWRPRDDGPAGLGLALERLLRQTSDAWSEQDRAAVGEFLQARIAEVRARDTAGTWLEHLTEALDYRRWNRFAIERHQNGQWRSATGPASGGERVLAASVPLFAAAASHYASAGNECAPRLVTLDEAFAGVDDNARAKYLGLLAAFDLDVVMTSEREWGCYPEVPGLAIAQLSRTDEVAAVLVTHWEWDGRVRRRVERPEPWTPDTGPETRPGEEPLWE